MATKSTASIALFLSFNLLIFTVVSCRESSCPPNPYPYPYPYPPPSIPSPQNGSTCPRDALQLGVCANVLDGLLGLTLGSPPVQPCCSLIQGLLDLEAAICLCTALNANILGINLNIQIALTLLLNVCSKEVPPGFLCA